jgi:type II secretory pathway component PulJ
MQFVQYPIIAALLVVLLVLYQGYRRKQKRLRDELETRMNGLKREMAVIEADIRRMSEKTDAVGKEMTSLKHGLTSVTDQVVVMRTEQTEQHPVE